MKKYTKFLSANFCADYQKKFDLPMNDEFIAGKTGVTTQTVKNWSDQTQGSIMGITKGKTLADMIGISFDEFFKTYIK